MTSPAPKHPVLTPWRSVAGVVLLTGFVALAAPAARDAVLRSRAREAAADLRVFAGVFRDQALRAGDWPAGDGTPAAIPAGMESLLATTAWSTPSPLGGHYTWDPDAVHQGSRHRAALSIVTTSGWSVSNNVRQLAALDRELDDGDLGSGNFLLGHRNHPILVLEH